MGDHNTHRVGKHSVHRQFPGAALPLRGGRAAVEHTRRGVLSPIARRVSAILAELGVDGWCADTGGGFAAIDVRPVRSLLHAPTFHGVLVVERRAGPRRTEHPPVVAEADGATIESVMR